MYPGCHALTNPDRPALIMTATGEIVTYAEFGESVSTGCKLAL